MKTIQCNNIDKFNSTHKFIKERFYNHMFLDDFCYALRDIRGNDYLNIKTAISKDIFLYVTTERLLRLINLSLTDLLFKGKAHFYIMEYRIEGDKESIKKFVLRNLFVDKSINGIRNAYLYNNGKGIFSIKKSQHIEIKLSEMGYSRNFFYKPLIKLDNNHDFAIDERLLYSNWNLKSIYQELEFNKFLITKDIYWDCRDNNANSFISLPYLYYRKEKFYNLKVNIFLYIINKINEALSDFFGINYDVITISDKICELNLYEKYVKNEISLKELQDSFYKSEKI